MDISSTYELWCRRAVADPDLAEELAQMTEADISDAFYRDLEFGTGGLRGVIGAGTNRMNVYTVGKASQGLSNYVLQHFDEQNRSIAISYDSRIKSDLFARIAAGIFAANGIKAYIYPELMPTPCLSYVVRTLGCSAGIMMTASHNPAKYNGYKVYGPDGCQITSKAATEILSCINALDIFDDVHQLSFEEGMKQGMIQEIGDDVLTRFLACVKAESVLGDAPADRTASIVYTPLNGTGLVPVTRILRECGYENVHVVPAQEKPDGHFTTCPYPNPETQEAMALGIEYAEQLNADLLMATDPDCDRIGIAVREKDGSFRLLSGNETGMLLLDYICQRRREMGTMPEHPIMCKTIVTIDMAERIAAHYGVRTINLLTGFKYIGEQIGILESTGKEKDYIFGFEESYGYLTGTYVRDKDAVDGAFIIAEMFAYYRAQNISLLDRLSALYAEYGYSLNTLHSYQFEGAAGFTTMQAIMDAFRKISDSISSFRIETIEDYQNGYAGLPKSNVLKFRLQNDCSLVIRPSGTEPKLKCYLSVSAPDQDAAKQREEALHAAVDAIIDQVKAQK